MIKKLLSLALLLSVCKEQARADTVELTITQLENRDSGIYVEWSISSSSPVLSQRVSYTDELDRTREYTTNSQLHWAYLQFVRPCMRYTVKVIVILVDGTKVESEAQEIVRTAIPVPPAPIDLVVSGDETGFKLQWELPETDTPISKFNIIGREDNGEMVHQSAAYDQTEAILDAFHVYHNYSITMTSENTCGVSEESEPVRLSELKVPGVPQFISTIPLPKSIRVTFEKNDDDVRVDKFHLDYTTPNGIQSIEPVDGSTTVVVLDKDIETCVKYEISLQAENAAGFSEVATTSAFAFSTDIPHTPKDIEVNQVDDHIEINWSSESTDDIVAHELVYESASGETGEQYVEGNPTQVQLEQIKRCETYVFRMRAENKCGYSLWTDWINFIVDPQAKPSRPMDLSVSGKPELVVLTWTAPDPSTYIEYYDLLLVNLASGSVTFWVPPAVTDFNLRNLNPGDNYAISIRAKNACGWSEPTDLLIEVTTDDGVRPLAFDARARSLLNRARRAAMA